jgi:hypothetical protein
VSLKYALLTMLARESFSGYDLIRAWRKSAMSISRPAENIKQQLAQVRKEVGDRSILTEHAENMPNHLREPDAAGKWRNADDDRHGHGELRQRRQREDLRPQCIQQFHLAFIAGDARAKPRIGE